jgi:Dna[CI] antecedent, DciA
MVEPDYFERKRRELGLDRADDLARVQAVLDRWYPGQARARRLHQGVLRVITPSAPLASELRMRQIELLEQCGLAEVRLAVSISTLS